MARRSSTRAAAPAASKSVLGRLEELVDQKTAKQSPLFRLEQRDRSDDRREYTAALDIRDEHPRRVEARDQAEIDEVVLPEVQLAHAARAFDHDDVEPAGEIVAANTSASRTSNCS